MPGAQPPTPSFEAKNFKNSTPNEISELSRTAFNVMKAAVYNAEIGLRAQLNRAQPEPKRQFIPMPSNLEVVEHTPVYEQPAQEVASWTTQNAHPAVQQTEVPTQPEQPTILDEDPMLNSSFLDEASAESRVANARQEVIDALNASAAEQPREDYPHAA